MKRRRGAAAAAVLKKHRKKGGGSKKSSKKDKHHAAVPVVEDDPLQDFLNENHDTERLFGKRVFMLEKIMAHKHANDKVVLNITERQDVLRQRQIDGLSHLVEARLERNSNYTAAFCLIVFFLISCGVIVAQRDVPQAFLVEGALFYNVLGDIGVVAPGEETVMELTRSDDFYDWLEGNLIDQVYTDPACGDGVCDSPDEFPGFGRFGCIPDCGRYKKTTLATVDMEDYFEYSKSITGEMHADNGKASEWDMSQVVDKKKDIHPDFRWNIWSDAMGDYIFAEPQKPTASGSPVKVLLPDGRHELRFFQYRKVSEEIDVGAIFDQLLMLPNTLPKRTMPTDYGYGDKLEAISAGAIMMKQLNDYCYSGKQDPMPKECESAANIRAGTAIPTIDTKFKALGSYGLSGKITIPNPKSPVKPPSPTVLVTAGFCGILKNGTQGIKNRYNKINFQAAGMDCGARRAGRRELRLSTEPRAWPEFEGDDGLPARHLLETPGAVGREFNSTDTGANGAAARTLLQAVGSSVGGVCVQHGDCSQVVQDAITGAAGQFCSMSDGCKTCSFCQIDGLDSINGLCPKAYCPDSGELPGCIQGTKLTRDWSCSDKKEFEIWKFHTKGTEVEVVPPGEAKVRWVTPFNRLVGPIMITQTRRSTGNCSKVVNTFIKSWASNGLDGNDGCLQAEGDLDGEPYGLDTAFVPGTALYDGNLIAEEHYINSERLNKTISESTSRGVTVVTVPSVPMGFFPYKWDQVNHRLKDVAGRNISGSNVTYAYRAGDADAFKLYFDTQITQSQAKSLLDYMKEGGFIDQKTSTIETQFITFNADLNRFTLVRFSFEWTAGGSITWDYWVESVVLDIYDLPTKDAQLTFEIIVCVMLGLNILLELIDIAVALRANKHLDYFANVGNLFDWLHFVFMGMCVGFWITICNMTDKFSMKTDSYPVLNDAYAGAKHFAVDAVNEEEYLRFADDIIEIATVLRFYNACAGVTLILFVFRILKALDFQPIMGVVTRTLWAASADMAHFVVLFCLITFGYAFAAVLLFGHQFGSTATVTGAFMLLIDIVVVMDTGVFYAQMVEACQNEFFVLMFIWSWIIVGFFLLINIFIAIVIDSYINVKEQNNSKVGMHEELSIMFTDWWKSVRLPKSRYLPDATLYKILNEKKMGLPSTYQLREAVLASMEEDVGIVLEEGVIVNRHSLRRILRGPADVEMIGSGKEAEPAKEEEEGALQDSSDDDEDINWKSIEEECIVEDLMDRYSAGHKGEEDQIIEAMRFDGMKRAVALFRHQQWMDRKLQHAAEVCERLTLRIVPASKQAIIAKQAAAQKKAPKEVSESRGLLRVTVVEAENLPKLDLMRASDPYCLVFLTDEKGEPGEIVYRTEVVPHNCNPVFNEEFLFSLYQGVEKVAVLIYDEDHITDDDLIGSVQVDLESLDPWVPTERWVQVQNSAREDQGIKQSRMRLQLTLQPANASLDDDSEADDSVSASHGVPAKGPQRVEPGMQLSDVDQGDANRSVDQVQLSTADHPFGVQK